MKASVVIPAWGETPYLDETKDCLAAQTFRDFEVVVAAPPKDEPNAGAARNEGLALTRGEWLFFVDADDLPEADFLTFLRRRLRLERRRAPMLWHSVRTKWMTALAYEPLCHI